MVVGHVVAVDEVLGRAFIGADLIGLDGQGLHLLVGENLRGSDGNTVLRDDALGIGRLVGRVNDLEGDGRLALVRQLVHVDLIDEAGRGKALDRLRSLVNDPVLAVFRVEGGLFDLVLVDGDVGDDVDIDLAAFRAHRDILDNDGRTVTGLHHHQRVLVVAGTDGNLGLALLLLVGVVGDGNHDTLLGRKAAAHLAPVGAGGELPLVLGDVCLHRDEGDLGVLIEGEHFVLVHVDLEGARGHRVAVLLDAGERGGQGQGQDSNIFTE